MRIFFYFRVALPRKLKKGGIFISDFYGLFIEGGIDVMKKKRKIKCNYSRSIICPTDLKAVFTIGGVLLFESGHLFYSG